jgi:14-3-3 protein epsilon
VGARRAAWRLTISIEHKEQTNGDTMKSAVAGDYCTRVRDEVLQLCVELLRLLDDMRILTHAHTEEANVFYLKMKADYQRYICEITRGDAKAKMAFDAKTTYEEALALAQKSLPVNDPTRLGLALNMSVFYREVLGDIDAASAMARRAFEDSIAELDCVLEDSYKDSTLIMQLLRDNLTLWTEETPVGTACAARVSKGSEFDVWDGLAVKVPQRNAAEHITCTIVTYNLVSGGAPSQEDIVAAIEDLEHLYASCTDSGRLAEPKFNFMKEEDAGTSYTPGHL